MKTFESIKDKLLKIKELSKKGIQGEAVTAKHKLHIYLKKYNLTLDDLISEKTNTYNFKINKKDQILFIHTLASIIGVRYKNIFSYKGKSNILYIDLTEVEYIDFKLKFAFHKKQLEKEIKKIIERTNLAYVYKHSLTLTDENTEPNNDVDYNELREIAKIMYNLEDVSYYRSIS